MQPHIEQTLADLGQRINTLTTIRDGILAEFCSLVPIAPLAPITPIYPLPLPAKPSRAPAKSPAKVSPKSPRSAPARTAGAQAVISATAALTEPFTGVQICSVTPLTKNGAGSAINRWTKKGWLKKVAFGQYVRTAKFPAAIGNRPPPIPVPSPAAPAGTPKNIDRLLADACAQRDHARESGRPEMVALFQREIDSLTATLD